MGISLEFLLQIFFLAAIFFYTQSDKSAQYVYRQ